jgi:hypothetical protein
MTHQKFYKSVVQYFSSKCRAKKTFSHRKTKRSYELLAKFHKFNAKFDIQLHLFLNTPQKAGVFKNAPLSILDKKKPLNQTLSDFL